MSRFTETNLSFRYSLGETIGVRVTAVNEKGASATPSDTSAGDATAKTVPAQMASDTIVRGQETSEYQVHVQWSELATEVETGGSPITSYNLQWDQGTDGGSWTDLVGSSSNYALTEFTVSDGIVKGTTYLFKIRARNIYGWLTDLANLSVAVV